MEIKNLGKNIYDIESSEELIQEIEMRLGGLENTVVGNHVNDILIPNVKKFGGPVCGKDFGLSYVHSLKNDFYTLVEDPTDEIANHAYDDFSNSDIETLYQVIYGEEL